MSRITLHIIILLFTGKPLVNREASELPTLVLLAECLSITSSVTKEGKLSQVWSILKSIAG